MVPFRVNVNKTKCLSTYVVLLCTIQEWIQDMGSGTKKIPTCCKWSASAEETLFDAMPFPGSIYS